MIHVERPLIQRDSPQDRLSRQFYKQWKQTQSEQTRLGLDDLIWPPLFARRVSYNYVPEVITEDSDALLEEYRFLVDLDRKEGLTPEQHSRLREVEEDLDDIDEATPEAQWMKSRMAETTDKLDVLLQTVRDLAARRSAA